MQNMKKNPIEMPVSFFLQHWALFGPTFAPKTTPTLIFLLISNEIYWGIQVILITCVAIQ